MPLVVPGITSTGKGDDLQSDWLNKLAGKKLGDAHDGMTFAKKDLPHKHQIIEPGSFTTMDHDKDRMKVHLGDDGTVRNVTFG